MAWGRVHEDLILVIVFAGVGVAMMDVFRRVMRSLEPSDPSRILVSEAMTAEPYTVEPDERVDVVAREMARRKIGSALVTHNGRLLGLFTATDALLALAALVEDDLVPGEPAEDDLADVASARERPAP